MKDKMNKYLITLISILLLAPVSFSFAADIDLSWDPSPSTAVQGYKVYYKANNADLPFDGIGANEGSSPIDVGDNLTTTITGLDDSSAYFFTVTAYDASGNESSPANIVSSSSLVPELLAPADKTTNEPIPVTFRWSTTSNMTYTLHYGTDPALAGAVVPVNSSTPLLPSQTLVILMLSLGLVLLSPWRLAKRKKLRFATAVFAISILAACGGGGGGESSGDTKTTVSESTETLPESTETLPESTETLPESTETLPESTETPPAQVQEAIDVGTNDYYQAYDMEPGTTYYWKVVAQDIDDQSQRFTSATGQFTTEVF